MVVGDAHVFPGFLTPVLTQLFFPKPPTTFLTCFCRGERRKYAGKKSRLNQGLNSQPLGHESDTLTTEPLERVALYQRTNLRLVQTESICRQQNKCNSRIEILLKLGRKHCGKRRKCWFPAFSPFSTMFSKGFFFRVIKCLDCVVKGYHFTYDKISYRPKFKGI